MAENKVQTVVTFNPPRFYEVLSWVNSKPTAVNKDIRIRKYRITIEEIPESNDVLAERLQTLWEGREGANHHSWIPFEKAARDLDYTLQGQGGAVWKKNKPDGAIY